MGYVPPKIEKPALAKIPEKENENQEEEKKGVVIADENDEDEINEDEYILPDKPSYFNMYDDLELDSEEEMVAGENNYIEIDCLPLEGQ